MQKIIFIFLFSMGQLVLAKTKSDTFMALGTYFYQQKDYIQAKKMLDSCVMFNNQNDHCGYYRAQIAFDEQDYKLAKIIFKGVLGLQPNDYASWNMLGLTFMELKHFDSAEFCFKNAVKLNSKEPKFFANWGKNQLLRGNSSHALELFNTAIFLDPKYSNFYVNRAIILEKLGRKDSAIQDLKVAQNLDPQNKSIAIKLKELSPSYLYLYIGLGVVFVLLFIFLVFRKKKAS
jgi:tetratricopeptide (TPR) repeat protein